MLTSVLGQRQDPTAWNVAIIQSTSTATESRRGCEEKESEGKTRLSGGDILPAMMLRKTLCLSSVAPMRHVSRIFLHNQRYSIAGSGLRGSEPRSRFAERSM